MIGTAVLQNSIQLDSLISHAKDHNENLIFLRKCVEKEAKANSNVTYQSKLAFTPDFMDNDPHLTIDPSMANSDRGTIPAELTGRGKVLCIEVKDSQGLEAGIRVTRTLEIYKRLSIGTLVQRLYGVLKKTDKLYYVMEDLQKIAHDLAVTTAYFHTAGLIVKVLNDSSIVLREKEGRLEPRLTNIEHARTLLDPTAYLSIDVRYEAPEYQRVRQHSKYTDVWSLGICIWQCMTGQTPFSITKPKDEDKEMIRNIRKQLAEGAVPFAGIIKTLPPGIVRIINGCCNPNPLLRFSAAYVAELLSDMMFSDSLETDLDYRALENTKQRILARVLSLRKASSSEPITEHDAKALLNSSNRDMDPTSCFLFGAAIWYEKVPVALYDVGAIEPIGVQADPKVRRATIALQYLDRATLGGATQASSEAYEAHKFLAMYHKGLVDKDQVESKTDAAVA